MLFGAVLVKGDKVMATGQNQVLTQNGHTYHAELGLIREHCHSHQLTDLSDHTLYTSCEPCVMCACACLWVKLGRLVYSCSKKTMDKYAGKRIEIDCKQLFEGSTFKPEVMGGVLEDEVEKVFHGYDWNR